VAEDAVVSNLFVQIRLGVLQGSLLGRERTGHTGFPLDLCVQKWIAGFGDAGHLDAVPSSPMGVSSGVESDMTSLLVSVRRIIDVGQISAGNRHFLLLHPKRASAHVQCSKKSNP